MRLSTVYDARCRTGTSREGLSMRRNIITTIVFAVGMTVYLSLLGHVVENQQAM